MTNEWREFTKLQKAHGELQLECAILRKAILKVPDLLIYGNWDYKRCLFCGGKRGHEDGCIRDKLEKEKNK